MKWDLNKDCPLLIVLGQSNAYGHGTCLPEQERIDRPLKNVWGLSWQKNRSYSISDVTWDHFVSKGMNLGNAPDHSCCLATEFAKKWQAGIDAGLPLPDLYTIQISIGGQGVDEQDIRDGMAYNMWWPDRPAIISPGPMGQADISLYPLTIFILKLAMRNIQRAGKNPVILGLHWNQWETEADIGGIAIERAAQNYTRIWQGFEAALGMPYPLFLYRPLSDIYHNPAGVAALTAFFEKAAQASPLVHLIDLTKSSFWQPDTPHHGIFQPDCVHYHADVQKWFAQLQWDFCLNEGRI